MSQMPPLLDRARAWRLGAVSALTLVQGVAAGAAALATRGLFDAMHRGADLPADLPIGLLATLVAAGAGIALCRVLARRQGERLGQDFARDLRLALFEHAAKMSVSAVAARRAGYMSLRFVGDMTAFRDWLALGLPRLVAAAVLVPCALVVLALLSPLLALVVLPLLALGLAGIALGGRRLAPLHRDLRARRARIAAEMAESMPLAPHLDMLGLRTRVARRLRLRTAAMIETALRRVTVAETLKALPDILAGVTAAAVIVIGFRTGATPGTIAGALAALGLILSPMRDLGSVWNLRAAYRAASEKAAAALARTQRPPVEARRSLPKGPLALALDAVLLPSGRVLSLKLAPGQQHILALDDSDAATLFDMIQRLETPSGGRVRLGRRDLMAISPGNLRRRVVRLGPEAPVLQGSVRRALSLGVDRRPDDASLMALAEAEGLGPMLDRLGGLNGRVQEGGRNLTARERTLIALVAARQREAGLVLLGPGVEGLGEAACNRVKTYLAATGASVLRSLPRSGAASRPTQLVGRPE